jgi:hypothetical protein
VEQSPRSVGVLFGLSRFLRVALASKTAIVAGLVTILKAGRFCPLIRQLNDPFGFIIGLAVGLPTYVVSVEMVRGVSSAEAWGRELRRVVTFYRPSGSRLLELGGRALYEEAFWRGTLQSRLGNEPSGVAASALLFTLQHVYFERVNRRPLRLPVVSEFALFSGAIGLVYARSQRLAVPIGIHLMRNLLIDAGCVPRSAYS